MRFCSCMAVVGLIAFVSLANASSGIVIGSVSVVRTHDATIFPQWGPPFYWVTLRGIAKAGSCPTFNTGEVLFVGTDKQSLALALSAQAESSQLAIAFNDADIVNGYCRLEYVSIGNPPPGN